MVCVSMFGWNRRGRDESGETLRWMLKLLSLRCVRVSMGLKMVMLISLATTILCMLSN